MTRAAAVEPRPTQRGMLCVYGFVGFLALGLAWVALDPAARQWPTAVFAMSVVLLMGTSALFHRVTWSKQAYPVIRRLDHAMIFVLITGTETPLFLIALVDRGLEAYFYGALAMAAAGFLITMFWIGAPKWVRTLVYIAVGWASVPVVGELVEVIGMSGVGMLLLGGGLYSVGGVAYGMKWPNPLPGRFGYHEVFHALVIAAVACHYAVIVFWVL